MRIIWINPVVKQMYEPGCLERFLKKHGFRQEECRKDWTETVRQEYAAAVEHAACPVADVRCPEVERLLREDYGGCGVLIPDIEPILLHCAREISGREELRGMEKVITTPCRSLADAGNRLELPDTRFVSWKQLLEEFSGAPEGKQPEQSPIPPGFFHAMGSLASSITGEDRIREYLRKKNYGETRMIEMLFCRDGCHHGDGIVGCGGGGIVSCGGDGIMGCGANRIMGCGRK